MMKALRIAEDDWRIEPHCPGALGVSLFDRIASATDWP